MIIVAEKKDSRSEFEGPAIKPLGSEAILKSVQKTRCTVSAEEHNIIGALGDNIA